MARYTYTFEYNGDLEKCEDCKFLGDRSQCNLMDENYYVLKEQFENCPLQKLESSHEKVETDGTFSLEKVEIAHEKVNDGVPFVSFSNPEITKMEMLGSQIKCRKCGEIHKVERGKRKNEDGTMSESNGIQFTSCDDGTTLMVGVMGKKINRWG